MEVFWAKHDCENDKNSIFQEGIKVGNKPENYKLAVFVPFDLKSCGSRGAFQNLKKGENRFIVWKGLTILGKGELPNFIEFN